MKISYLQEQEIVEVEKLVNDFNLDLLKQARTFELRENVFIVIVGALFQGEKILRFFQTENIIQFKHNLENFGYTNIVLIWRNGKDMCDLVEAWQLAESYGYNDLIEICNFWSI
jgi:hypothetical protein